MNSSYNVHYFIDRIDKHHERQNAIFEYSWITCIDTLIIETSIITLHEEGMLGSQMKWAKFLSANLPKVDETNQNEEEKEESNEEVY